MIFRKAPVVFLCSLLLFACQTHAQQEKKDLSDYETAYFAAGCFWCVEAIFESMDGVAEAVSGYSGGNEKNPTYQQVSRGLTGHAETVEVYYDPKIVSYRTLVKVFFGSHDPTTLNRQGPDMGTQYRSVAFYKSDDEKKVIEDQIKKLEREKLFGGKIITEVVPFRKFWKAENYHQNYEKLNPDNPYIQNVSVPRVSCFKTNFPELLKEEH